MTSGSHRRVYLAYLNISMGWEGTKPATQGKKEMHLVHLIRSLWDLFHRANWRRGLTVSSIRDPSILPAKGSEAHSANFKSYIIMPLQYFLLIQFTSLRTLKNDINNSLNTVVFTEPEHQNVSSLITFSKCVYIEVFCSLIVSNYSS